MMKRFLQVVAVTVNLGMAPVILAADKAKGNAADYTVKVHVSEAKYPAQGSSFQVLKVEIAGKHYRLLGSTSSAKYFAQGNGLLNPGDYVARLSTDVHKTSFESLQTYEFLLPDGTTRTFQVTLQTE